MNGRGRSGVGQFKAPLQREREKEGKIPGCTGLLLPRSAAARQGKLLNILTGVVVGRTSVREPTGLKKTGASNTQVTRSV